jgi:hypothetical protein
MVNVVAGIIPVDVVYNRVSSGGATTVYDMEIVPGVVLTISDDDRVAITVANGKKINFKRHKHLLCFFEGVRTD